MNKEKLFLMRKWKRKAAFFLMCFFLLTSLPLPKGMGESMIPWMDEGISSLKEMVGNTVNEVFASDFEYFLLGPGNVEINLSGASSDKVVDLTNGDVTLTLQSKKKGEASFSPIQNAKITLTQNGEKVAFATVDTVGTTTTSLKLEQRGVGSEQIVGKVEIAGGIYNFSFLAKSDIGINKKAIVPSSGNKEGFTTLFSTDLDVNYLLMPILEKTYQIDIKGYKDLITSGGALKDYKNGLLWNLSSRDGKSENVAKIDPVTGVITSVGAGHAELLIEANYDVGKKVKPVKVEIFTPLRISERNVEGGEFDNFINDVKGKVFHLSGTTQKTFYTNAFDPADLEWEVTKEGKKVKDFSVTAVSSITGTSASSIILNIPRAGTYEVMAKIKNIPGKYEELPLAKTGFTVVVPVTTRDKTIYLNVGDTFNIYENSNIGDVKDYNFSLESGAGIVSVNSNEGIITAIKTGTATVNVVGTGGFKLTMVVIDTLSLNAGNITIPIGGSFNLTATSTDISTADSWKWTSDRPDIATVEGNGILAIVKGIKAGETTVTVEHRTSDGVSKRVSAKVNVTAGVTGIKLIPTEEIVDVGKVVSIKATVEPKTSQETYLYWRSSNPKIVEVDNENEHSAVNSVTAKAPGVAVIMALNKDNVVLGSCTITVRVAVTEIRLTEKVVEKTMEDKTHQLSAIVLPEGATVTKLRWTSTKPEIALVDENGLVTFKKPGNTTIICASESDPKIMDTCDINVIKGIAGIKADKSQVSIAVGENYQLNVTIVPSDATGKNLIFTSLDTKVATVSSTGLIVGKAPGTAYITVSTVDKKFTTSCTVKVIQKAIGFRLNASALVLDVGERYTLEGTFNPKTTSDTKITWTTSDASVAKVDAKGRVVGVGAGKCIINATTSNSLNALCYITVNKPVSSISLTDTEVTIAVGDEHELEVSFDSDDVTNKDVKWKTSDSAIATVDKKGVVKGKAGGIAIITVTSEENGMTANCIVTVEEPVAAITLNKKSLNLGYHHKFTLVATIKNNSATRKKIKWSSNKKSVVTVDKNGMIYGKKIGYAIIKAKATDGSGAEATCRVRVVRAANSLSISDSFLNMVVGKTHKLKVKVSPKNATYKTAKYKSDNTEVAIVDNKGKITALSAGKAKIIVTTKDSSNKKQACIVQVREYVPSTGITLSSTSITLGVGDKQSIIYSLSPNGSDDEVTWTSNNKAAVRTNKKGVITAIAPGSSVVSATTSSGKTANVSVTVVGLNFKNLSLEQYDTYRLSVLGDIKNIIWDSSDNSIATVTGGVVTAKKEGECEIYARVNGALLTCKVRVTTIR